MPQDYGREAADWLAKLSRKSPPAAFDAEAAAKRIAAEAKEMAAALEKLKAQAPTEAQLKALMDRVGAKAFENLPEASAPAASADFMAMLDQLKAGGADGEAKMRALFEQNGLKFEAPGPPPDGAATAAAAAVRGPGFDAAKALEGLTASAAGGPAKLLEMMRELGIDPANWKPPKIDAQPDLL